MSFKILKEGNLITFKTSSRARGTPLGTVVGSNIFMVSLNGQSSSLWRFLCYSWSILRVKECTLTILQVDGKVLDSWVTLVDGESEDPPDSLVAANVPSCLILPHFIMILFCDVEDGHVRSFIDVFTYIFDGFDGVAEFHVDVDIVSIAVFLWIKCRWIEEVAAF